MTLAAEPHETLHGEPHRPSQQRLMCHVDGTECEVLARIMPALTSICTDQAQLAQSLDIARRWTSCGCCRAATAAAARLPGTRLGEREREILRRAPPPGSGQGEVLCGATDTRARREATLRAARKLFRVGLVSTERREVEGTRRDRRRGKWAYSEHGCDYYYRKDLTDRLRIHVATARLTPLGAEIRQRYLAELTDDRAIRWDGRVANAAAAARQNVGTLLDALEKEMHEYSAWALQLVAMIAPFNVVGAKPYVDRHAAADRVSRAIHSRREARS